MAQGKVADYELISFELCPYVQRARTVLLLQGVEHRVTFIDLVDPPPWFFDVSPLGQVPVLKFEDEAIFESTAICEYLNEVTQAGLFSDEPWQRARERGAVAVASSCIDALSAALGASDRPAFKRATQVLGDKLDWFEEVLDDHGGAWFAGERFAMADVAFAPVANQLRATVIV